MKENWFGIFLKELQALDESTKRKVLVVSVIVIMVGVLFVWVAYFNSIVIPSVASSDIAGATSTTAVPPVAPLAVPAAGPGFWESIGNGFAAFGNGVADGLHGIGNIFHGGHEYIKP